MNTLKTGQGGHAVSSPEGAGDTLIDRGDQAKVCDAWEQTTQSMETFRGLQARMKPQSLRVAIKVKGKILFVNLGDVVSVQARGKCVCLQRNTSSYIIT
jgi:hypothetical protein